MQNTYNLQRFTSAQQSVYARALGEIKNGKKQSHWMWYIFPQIRGLGFSETSKLYAIKDIHEAEAYLADEVLGKRLLEISTVLAGLTGSNATTIFGSPDDMKLQSCMTLFGSLQNAPPIFQSVLNKYFNGKMDNKTLQILASM